ncbi:M56 family metallopeptidase [Cytophagaceae bacterium DM2B3-1]|uniref:M56 family metallopeptidase n=1 Tax=Xanthocytophaga flava TaxID=3048013 RepID=A0ABT7CWY3_9BACT|nr:M56 family metallopeptidase [Xanthocytophaga flavus]MDJ1498286.1 M56 family metallopeptidase [Xanthocytophaga flavus]
MNLACNLILYLLQASIGLALFISLYRFTLAKLTFFIWNRSYLIATAFSSLLIPFLHIDFFFIRPFTSESLELVAKLPALTYWRVNATVLPLDLCNPYSSWQISILVIFFVYGAIAFYHVYKLSVDVYSVLRLIGKYPRFRYDQSWIIYTDELLGTCSFFTYIFIGKADQNSSPLKPILAHEQVHTQHGHSFDWLFIQLLGALFWFHPCIRWWKQALKDNHEYIADSYASKHSDTSTYATLLLSVASRKNNLSTLHYFSYGQLKSRIIMLHQPNSNTVLRVRFLLTFPLVFILLLFSSCTKQLVGPREQISDPEEFNKVVQQMMTVMEKTMMEKTMLENKLPQVLQQAVNSSVEVRKDSSNAAEVKE